uniref:Uncharacterized protein n=1 Tax=Oryza glumipatula TaxID=40148 RepID=A0A0D9YPH0_9ORYZ
MFVYYKHDVLVWKRTELGPMMAGKEQGSISLEEKGHAEGNWDPGISQTPTNTDAAAVLHHQESTGEGWNATCGMVD